MGSKGFIGPLSLAILFQLIALIFHWWLVDWALPPFTNQINSASHGLHVMYGLIITMKISATLMTIGFGVLSGWIIARLCSVAVRREFVHE